MLQGEDVALLFCHCVEKYVVIIVIVVCVDYVCVCACMCVQLQVHCAVH